MLNFVAVVNIDQIRMLARYGNIGYVHTEEHLRYSFAIDIYSMWNASNAQFRNKLVAAFAWVHKHAVST